MTADEIRRRFLQFFAERDHRVVRSSSLIPQSDPTLLFTNAGMNQFKDLFLGREKRDYSRAATSQKCVRAGGKHNDLDNVGYTNRHLTLFEMLGNFSFGDYFKRDAIQYAWELLTVGLGLPGDRLSATVYLEDDEAYQLWRDVVGLPEARISRLGKEDNFWAMGETGPCGPCSEIYIDSGRGGCGRPECAPGCDCGRFVEIWNLVFMQFDRDAAGLMTPLPAPSIDTGMGLERIAMAMQGVETVYDTDLLRPILDQVAARAGTQVGASESTDVALRVIGDHIRSSTFLLADGVLPASIGRGYVLRRIIRRAARFGKRLGFEQPFLHELSGFVVDRMGEAYPDLIEARTRVARVLHDEEQSFARALARSGREFEEIATSLDAGGQSRIDGSDAFRLYSTHGLPLDTLKDMAEVRGLTVDESGFERELSEDRRRSRDTWKGGADGAAKSSYQALIERGRARFVGYQQLEVGESTILAILRDQTEVDVATAGDKVEVVLSETPFYPEGGGQVGDRGTIRSTSAFAVVEETAQPVPGVIVHRAVVRQGTLRRDERVEAAVDGTRRRSTASNHSATHLLHAALRGQLGDHVKQAGSRVDADRLRFDFTHHARPEPDELTRIEALVNQRVSLNDPVEAAVMPIDEALAKGALAFFGDKYGDQVRVIRMGDFSTELCGGTHVHATGNIGYFRVIASAPVAAGVRRIEAVTGETAVLQALTDQNLVEELAGRLNVPRAALIEHVDGLRDELKVARKDLKEIKLKLAAISGGGGDRGGPGDDDLREVGGARIASRRVEGLDRSGMRSLADQLRTMVGSGVVLLGTLNERGAASILVCVTPDLIGRVDAGQVVRAMAEVVGGKGGGRPDMAEAGGPDGTQLDQSLAAGLALVERRLSGQTT